MKGVAFGLIVFLAALTASAQLQPRAIKPTNPEEPHTVPVPAETKTTTPTTPREVPAALEPKANQPVDPLKQPDLNQVATNPAPASVWGGAATNTPPARSGDAAKPVDIWK